MMTKLYKKKRVQCTMSFSLDKEQVTELGWELVESFGESPKVLIHVLHPSLLLTFCKERV